MSESEKMGSKIDKTYKSYSYSQKLKVVKYALLNSETEASKRYGIPRSTLYYWKDIDKVPTEKLKKLAKKRKGKHLKMGSGQPLSYSSEQDDQVLSWVLKQWDLHLLVTRKDIHLVAKKLPVRQIHHSKLHLAEPVDSWDAILCPIDNCAYYIALYV